MAVQHSTVVFLVEGDNILLAMKKRGFAAAGQLHFKNQGGLPDMMVHIFMCTAWDGEPVESEEMAPRWFKISDIPYDKMWQDDPFWLPQVLGGKYISGNFVFDEHDTMLSHEVREA